MALTLSALRRLGAALGVLAAVAVLLFAATEVLPGSAATAALGSEATPEQVAARAAKLGLDRSAPDRFLGWVGGLLTGDPGTSYATLAPVDITDELVNSVILAGLAGALTVLIATVAGVLAGSRAGSGADRAISGTTLAVVAVPEFALAGLLVTVLALGLGWFPAVSLVPLGGTPLDAPSVLVLPVASLALVAGAFATRLVRGAVADVAGAAHVESARLAGLPEPRVLLRYLLPTAAAPVAQSLAYVTGFLLGGTVVIERVFGYPGLGSTLANAVAARDTPTVQAVGMVAAVAVVGAFLLADLVGLAADPRRRGATR